MFPRCAKRHLQGSASVVRQLCCSWMTTPSSGASGSANCPQMRKIRSWPRSLRGIPNPLLFEVRGGIVKTFLELLSIGQRPCRVSTSAIIVLLNLTLTDVAAQSLQRSVEVESQHRNDAVVVTGVALGNTFLQCGLPESATSVQPVVAISGGPDWLSHLTIYLLNRTEKTVVYGELQLGFPETGDGKSAQAPMTIVPLRLGIMPSAVAYLGSGQLLPQENRPLFSITPGQTVPIPLSPAVYSDIQRNLASRMPDSAAVSRLVVRRGSFIFADNMKWNKGSFWLPDPQKPGNWIAVSDRRFFPGKQAWPPVLSR